MISEFPFIIFPRVCFRSIEATVSDPLPIHINPLSLFIDKIHRLSYTTKFTVICFNLKYNLLFHENPCICAYFHLVFTFGLGIYIVWKLKDERYKIPGRDSLQIIMLPSWLPHSLLFPCKEGAGRATYLFPYPL